MANANKYELIDNPSEFYQFKVWELPTEQVVFQSNEKHVARKWMNQRKGGIGFNGWTPKFLILEVDSGS
jgi:hypothetical protein